MKKTVTVNLDKTIFNIDDDAYTVLESYLEALHDHFKKEEGGQEIMNDIESRISELFKERLGFGMQVITLQEVNEVIAIMGQPDEIENPLDSGTAPDNNADGDNSGQTTDTSNNESHKSTKRLYRDPDNRILGGVASGMGYYFGIDTVAIRVIMVLLLPLWASSVWIYLLLWICIPEARTTSQKLEMRNTHCRQYQKSRRRRKRKCLPKRRCRQFDLAKHREYIPWTFQIHIYLYRRAYRHIHYRSLSYLHHQYSRFLFLRNSNHNDPFLLDFSRRDARS